MSTSTLLPDPDLVELDHFFADGETLTLVVRACREAVACPDCGQLATRVHSRYTRLLATGPAAASPLGCG